MPDIAWVDTIDVCQMKCPTCIRGARGLKNSARKMDMQLFSAIATRLRGGYSRIGLFNWTEPYLNRNIEDYVSFAKSLGFWITLSSTLSLRKIPNLEASLVAGVDLLTVSVSGADQATYEINHVDGNWDYVVNNLAVVSEIIKRRGLSTRVDLRLLRFKYNGHHEPIIRAMAEKFGFAFELAEGVGDPTRNELAGMNNAYFMRESEAAKSGESPEDRGQSCELMFNQIAIDCMGDVYICCAMPNYPTLRIGRYLDLSDDQILALKFKHAFCRACKMPRRERSARDQVRLNAALSVKPSIEAAEKLTAPV